MTLRSANDYLVALHIIVREPLKWKIRREPFTDVQTRTHSDTVNCTTSQRNQLSLPPSHQQMIYALDSFVFRAFTHGAEGKASKKSPVGIDTSAMNKMMKNFDKC